MKLQFNNIRIQLNLGRCALQIAQLEINFKPFIDDFIGRSDEEEAPNSDQESIRSENEEQFSAEDLEKEPTKGK